MTEVIVFPDAEAIIAAYLNQQYALRSITNTSAGTKAPLSNSTVAGKKFTRVTRTGGSVVDRVIDRVQITLDSYGATETEAFELARLNRGLMYAIDRVTVAATTYQFYEPQEFAGPGNLPDPDTGQERYTETFSVGVRGTAL